MIEHSNNFFHFVNYYRVIYSFDDFAFHAACLTLQKKLLQIFLANYVSTNWYTSSLLVCKAFIGHV